MEQRYKILVISGENYFRKEVVAYDMTYNNAVIAFWDENKDIIALYPTDRTIIECVENI
jgi:hypothetical protein